MIAFLQDLSSDEVFQAALATAPVGVDDVAETPNELRLFPNPSNGTCNLFFQGRGESEFSLYNVNGALVMNRKVAATTRLHQRIELDTESLVPGMYLVRVTGLNGTSTAKLLVQ